MYIENVQFFLNEYDIYFMSGEFTIKIYMFYASGDEGH